MAGRISSILQRWILAVLYMALVLSAGCSNVEPWERGALAKPQMALEPHPLHRGLLSHVQGSREGTAGASAGQGGGCGCN